MIRWLRYPYHAVCIVGLLVDHVFLSVKAEGVDVDLDTFELDLELSCLAMQAAGLVADGTRPSVE